MAYIGIDVSKLKLDVLWLRSSAPRKIKTRVFKNDHSGLAALCVWLQKQTGESAQGIHVVMEATGVYHEPLAYALHEAGMSVYVANPARVKEFSRSEGQRNKTDKSDAQMLALYLAEKHARMTLWQPLPTEIRHLRALITRVDALEKDLRREQNRLEKTLVTDTTSTVVTSIELLIETLTEEIKRLRGDIEDHIDRHSRLKQDRSLLKSIPGIADITSAYLTMLMHSRTFSSARQCAAFLGLTPGHYESGSSVYRPSRISKSGSNLRSKLYMAAVTATTYNPDIRGLKQRLQAKGKSGKAIIVAAMRRLVHIAYGVLKHQQEYAPQPA